MKNGKVITIEDRIPKLKEERKRRANRRLITYISLFFLLILLVVYLQSPISKVGKVNVEGNYYVPNSEIIKSGGLTEEVSFWNVKKEQVENKIMKDHVHVSSVDLHKRLPNTITIEVKEYSRVAYLKEKTNFYPILENGQVLDKLSSEETPINAPILVNLNKAKLEEMAAELKKVPQSLIQRISEIQFTPSETVSYDLIMYMNDGFEVRTSVRNFADNINKYPAIVQQIEEGKNGIIHLNVSSYFEEHKNGENKEETTFESEG